LFYRIFATVLGQWAEFVANTPVCRNKLPKNTAHSLERIAKDPTFATRKQKIRTTKKNKGYENY
jgi:hypothetical protein